MNCLILPLSRMVWGSVHTWPPPQAQLSHTHPTPGRTPAQWELDPDAARVLCASLAAQHARRAVSRIFVNFSPELVFCWSHYLPARTLVGVLHPNSPPRASTPPSPWAGKRPDPTTASQLELTHFTLTAPQRKWLACTSPLRRFDLVRQGHPGPRQSPRLMKLGLDELDAAQQAAARGKHRPGVAGTGGPGPCSRMENSETTDPADAEGAPTAGHLPTQSRFRFPPYRPTPPSRGAGAHLHPAPGAGQDVDPPLPGEVLGHAHALRPALVVHLRRDDPTRKKVQLKEGNRPKL